VEPNLAIHTAARRFCIEQDAYWSKEYAELQSSGKAQVHDRRSSAWHYSDLAYEMFPRYRLAQATLKEVESILPQGSNSLNELRNLLIACGQSALGLLKEEFRENKTAQRALSAESSEFIQFLTSLSFDHLQTVEPLPYQRTLSATESKRVWADLQSRWGIQGPGYGWFPISDAIAPAGAVAVHDQLWDSRDGNQLLHQFLAENSIARCFVVNEINIISTDCEIDSQVVDPLYRGSELFITALSDWVLYASHESSYTLAGSIADYFRKLWPDCDKLSYGGPFHTSDLRGTWNSSAKL